MNKTILMSVSALALVMAMPAFAAGDVKTETGGEVKVEGPNTANKATDAQNTDKISSEEIEEAAEDVGDAVEEAYRDMRNFFRGETAPRDLKNVQVVKAQTAAGMIGKPVMGMNDAKIGTVHDIIVDKNGNAKMVVVSDGGLLGLGDKLAAFDYDVIVSRNKDGDVISTLNEKTVDRAAEFSYDAEKSGENVRVMPAGGYSIAKILDAQLLNQQNEAVADVDNVSFRNGQADLLIVTFNKVLGLGGEKAVMNYSELSLVQKDKDVDFQLSAQQAAQFEKFKETKASN